MPALLLIADLSFANLLLTDPLLLLPSKILKMVITTDR